MGFFDSKKAEKERMNERESIKRQINECLDYIKLLRSGFNETADTRLVNYYIYENRAAEMKYHYLLRLYSEMTGDGA